MLRRRKYEAIVKSLLWTSLFWSFAPPAAGQTYTIVDLGILPGETASASIGINSLLWNLNSKNEIAFQEYQHAD